MIIKKMFSYNGNHYYIEADEFASVDEIVGILFERIAELEKRILDLEKS